MLPLPLPADVAAFSGRPEDSYTSYINSAIIQAALQLTIATELTPNDWPNLAGVVGTTNYTTPDLQLLATQGILAMADWIYLRQPYQQVIASPLMNESIGSYSYGKAQAEVARNAAALEVTGERTNIVLYDLAVQILAKRTVAGGVFSGGITVFENAIGSYDGAELEIRPFDGRFVLVGPSQVNQGAGVLSSTYGDVNTGFGQDSNLVPVFANPNVNVPWDVNSPAWPGDPGI